MFADDTCWYLPGPIAKLVANLALRCWGAWFWWGARHQTITINQHPKHSETIYHEDKNSYYRFVTSQDILFTIITYLQWPEYV